jgi:ATP-binding cassette subfamily A (ABC1) protein 3
VYRLIPSYSLSHALAQTGNIELVGYLFNLQSRGGDPNNPVKLTFWSLPVAGEDMLFLAGGAVGYSLLLMVLQGVFRSGTARPKFLATWHFSEGVETGIALEDIDVQGERAYVEGLAPSALKAATGEQGDLRAVMRNVRKVYQDGKVAVQQLSLGFRKNECFGLLGTNGAGKTTAQSMLCGELSPSRGEIYINGKNVLSPSSAALRNLGYCPQFDPIYDLLTAREHLMLYGKIRGVRDLDAAVETILTELQLTRFADRLAGGYSGGNKRKLSLAMAVIGNPALVLLDEPSAGIDPSARRAVSAFVQKLAKQTSVVLTTHSMEECEALCSRVGIMVDGGLRCLNSVQAIKSRYGQGYQIEITLRSPTQEEVLALARECDLEQQINLVIVNRDFCKELLAFLGDERLYAAHFVGSDLDLQLKAGPAKLSVRAFVLWLFSARAADRILHMLITKMDPETKLESREGRRLRFKVPITTKLSVADMFDVVEQGKSKAGIEDFALSQTTLETIFSMFAKTAGLDPAKVRRRNQQRQQEEVPVARVLDP